MLLPPFPIPPPLSSFTLKLFCVKFTVTFRFILAAFIILQRLYIKMVLSYNLSISVNYS